MSMGTSSNVALKRENTGNEEMMMTPFQVKRQKANAGRQREV